MNNQSLTIMHHNIRGLNNKINELKILIDTHQPDIITLNETLNIKPNTKIKNYTITHPTPNHGQGVAILHKNELTIDIEPQITTSSNTTNLHFAITLHTPSDSIQIATIYCPQKHPSTEIITNIIKRNPNTIITGDFNCRHEDFGHDKSDRHGRLLQQTMNKHRYTKLNDNEPTFHSDRTHTEDVKDLIYSSPEISKRFRDFWVDEDLGSDHKTIFATFSHKGTYHPTPHKKN